MAFVRRITVIEGGNATTMYTEKKKRKKLPRWAKPLEKRQRYTLEAGKKVLTEMLRLHKKSNRKRKNGWLRDAPNNLFESSWKGARKLKKNL